MVNDLYEAPKSKILSPQSKSLIWGKRLGVMGTVLIFAFPLGAWRTIIEIMEVFLAIKLYGGDIWMMEYGISQALVNLVVGVLIAILGIISVCLSIFVFQYKVPWIHKFLIGHSILLLMTFPIAVLIDMVFFEVLVLKFLVGYSSFLLITFLMATLIGLVLLIVLILKKSVFYQNV